MQQVIEIINKATFIYRLEMLLLQRQPMEPANQPISQPITYQLSRPPEALSELSRMGDLVCLL